VAANGRPRLTAGLSPPSPVDAAVGPDEEHRDLLVVVEVRRRHQLVLARVERQRPELALQSAVAVPEAVLDELLQEAGHLADDHELDDRHAAVRGRRLPRIELVVVLPPKSDHHEGRLRREVAGQGGRPAVQVRRGHRGELRRRGRRRDQQGQEQDSHGPILKDRIQ